MFLAGLQPLVFIQRRAVATPSWQSYFTSHISLTSDGFSQSKTLNLMAKLVPTVIKVGGRFTAVLSRLNSTLNLVSDLPSWASRRNKLALIQQCLGGLQHEVSVSQTVTNSPVVCMATANNDFVFINSNIKKDRQQARCLLPCCSTLFGLKMLISYWQTSLKLITARRLLFSV